MWSTDSHWFEVALLMGLTAIGGVLVGHFEAHKPKWRRVTKILVANVLFVGVSVAFGRIWFWALLGVLALAVLYVHLIWLPKNGVNGWTGEPRERYLELVGPRGPRA